MAQKIIHSNGASLRLGQESWCLPNAGFLLRVKYFWEVLDFRYHLEDPWQFPDPPYPPGLL